MKDGAAVEEGNTEQVILEPREDYTRRLVDSVLCI
jgi:ABC-type microcin C transport system duplicated ATPase subunit YejF